MKASEFLRETAKHIQKVGLNQNGLAYDYSVSQVLENCPACIYGAMDIVRIRIGGPGMAVNREAIRELRKRLKRNQGIPDFSDNAESQAVVTDMLEKVARGLESKGR